MYQLVYNHTVLQTCELMYCSRDLNCYAFISLHYIPCTIVEYKLHLLFFSRIIVYIDSKLL